MKIFIQKRKLTIAFAISNSTKLDKDTLWLYWKEALRQLDKKIKRKND